MTRAALLALLALLAFLAFGAAAMDVSPFWNFADPDASEAAFRKALATTTGLDETLILQTQIARSYGLRSRFAEAHALLDSIEPRLVGAGPEPRVRCLLERGRTYRSSKAPERARPLFVEAADRARAEHLDALEVDALHMIALVEPAPEAQLRWNRQALGVAAASSDPTARNWDASLANNIGMSLHDAGRDDEALASFETALAARERIGDATRIHEARWMIAWTLRLLHRHDDALVLLRRLESDGMAGAQSDGYLFEEIGENLLAQGHEEAARPYFARAWALLDADHSLDRPSAERLARLQRLGR